MADQPGSDPLPQDPTLETYTTLRSLYDNTIQPGRILIFVRTKDGWPSSPVLVPLPHSYDEAILIALHQLGKHIYIKPGSPVQDARFLYRPKPTPADDVWADLPPEFWNEIVQDGDQLMLITVSASSNTAPTSVKTMAKYIELLQRPAEGVRIGRIISFPRPTSYGVARIVAQRLFYQGKTMSDIFLFVKKPSQQWRAVVTSINDKDWMDITEGNAEDVEIAVWTYLYK